MKFSNPVGGVPPPTIQKILGHKDVLITIRYLCDEDIHTGATAPLAELFANAVLSPASARIEAVRLPGSNVLHARFGVNR